MPESNWRNLLITFLHDPPNKALDIRGHESRARRFVSAVLGVETGTGELRTPSGVEDILASLFERLPAPRVRPQGMYAVHPDTQGRLQICHPLAGTPRLIETAGISDEEILQVIRDLIAGVSTEKEKFFILWSFLPQALAKRCQTFEHLPADTRVPDHSIWQHLDMATALRGALAEQGGACLLTLTIGPVQQFIDSARTLRDLWSGSAILSWLSFRAMLPIIEAIGPQAILTPALRYSLPYRIWLSQQAGGLPEGFRDQAEAERQALPMLSLPNRFLALVPYGKDGSTAVSLAGECRASVLQAWRSLGQDVRQEIRRALGPDTEGWDRLWDAQIDNCFDVKTTVFPWSGLSEELVAELSGSETFAECQLAGHAARSLEEAMPQEERPSKRASAYGMFQAWVELTMKMAAARKQMGHVPPCAADGLVAQKCTMMGTWEQMGPAVMAESAAFWERFAEVVRIGPARLRSRERLCAVALAKRFAVPCHLQKQLALGRRVSVFPDIASVAAASWIRKAGLAEEAGSDSWNGQWLHWRTRDQDPDETPPAAETWSRLSAARRNHGAPPAYYAVLVLDGDRMGAWLRGDRTISIGEAYNPLIRDYFAKMPKGKEALTRPKPLGPSTLAAASEALSGFASFIVPRIVAAHDGTLIYAGGDDVLALLPMRSAIVCAHALRLAFSGDPAGNDGAPDGYYRIGDRDLLVMGPRASLSAGIAIVHVKEDLRVAIAAARQACKMAKDTGRDALSLAVQKRSGEHANVLLTWPSIQLFEHWMMVFEQDASDRWVYVLRRELETIAALGADAFSTELVRLLNRAEPPTPKLFREESPVPLDEAWRAWLEMWSSRLKGTRIQETVKRAAEQFVLALLSASFVVRGGDGR